MNTLTEVQNIVHFKDMTKQIVQIIVQNRKQANLTQNELAEMLGIDRRKIIALEAGKFDLIGKRLCAVPTNLHKT